MSETEVVYRITKVATDDALHPLIVELLVERRRSLITELRKIEEILGLPSSLPIRRRPH